MTRSLVHTVTRRAFHGKWIALRMCGDQEMYRESGETRDDALLKLRKRQIPDIVASVFDKRKSPFVNE